MAQCSNKSRLSRGLQIIDFMLESEHVTLEDVSKEFNISKTTIRRDINLVGSEAFFGYSNNSSELKKKFLKVKRILDNNKKTSSK